MSVLEIKLQSQVELSNYDFIPIGMGAIETYLPNSADIANNKCFDRNWISSWRQPGTYCDEPYLIQYSPNELTQIHPTKIKRVALGEAFLIAAIAPSLSI